MYEITEGTIHLFTFREGLLSAVGHDLRLSVKRFVVAVDRNSVTGKFWADSLFVDGAVREGVLSPGTLSAKDIAEIREHTMGRKILHASRHPVILLTASLHAADDGSSEVSGALEINGRTGPVAVAIRSEGGRLRGGVTLTPSRWGIAPFKALLGTLRIQDRVDVRFDLPDPR